MSRTNGGYPIRIELPTDLPQDQLNELKQEMYRKHGPYLDVYRVKDKPHLDDTFFEQNGRGVGSPEENEVRD